MPNGPSVGGMAALSLTLVRHGESEANVAAAIAHDDGAEVIDVPARDADVALSPAGVAQAQAWGRALAAGTSDSWTRFDSLWCSPFRRARQTAQVAFETAGIAMSNHVDERLRDRDLGQLDTLTAAGVRARHADEAARRRWLGKFYHRPAGGESWVDVIARVRSLLRDIDDREDGNHVLVVCHDVVIMSIRYVCEELSEDVVLDIARGNPVRNCSLTRLVRDADGQWTLDMYNDVAHLERHGAPVTKHPGERHEHAG